ncbi:MAG: FAD-dependent oxidoreductase [candidate division KSB1 bacterium]|nr:FAD-dependent oxidoreductase [candidate division KSB1 bacterium]MDZ7295466.1 FAD-dependent oxidoreductase [candidate division KSB1 bacterium]MDZ7393703.1 FAD-dependent oxidoreductase [candidate division KSB1 bacterium]
MARQREKSQAVLVVGAGVAGLRAALELADMGVQVHLVDKSTMVGGKVLQLDRQFPSDDCGFCKMLPPVHGEGISGFCLRRGLTYPNVHVLFDSHLTALAGRAGNFVATVTSGPRYIDPEMCISCGRCVSVCPVKVKDEFEGGLGERKAVYVRHGLAIPRLYTIDMGACTRCGECVRVCPTEAISLDAQPTTQQLQVGAVVAALGFEEFDPSSLSQFGYGRVANVVTSTELERMTSRGGPSHGVVRRPSDGQVPDSVAFLQCVGSRDADHDFCSSACCMFAIKEAAHLQAAGIPTQIFYMDIRAFGKGYHRVYQQAQKDGVAFVRCRVSALEEQPQSKNVIVVYEAEDGTFHRREFGLVVLSVGLSPAPDAEELARVLGIRLNRHGFVSSPGFSAEATGRAGIFVCGTLTAPRDIPESVAQGLAAAGQAALAVKAAKSTRGLASGTGTLQQSSQQGAARIGVFLCSCAGDISQRLDVDSLATMLKALPGVAHVVKVDLLCLRSTLKEVAWAIAEKGLNRVVFGACSPHLYEARFAEMLKEVNLAPPMVEVVPLREQVAWIHADRRAATNKAAALLRAAAARLQGVVVAPSGGIAVTPRALVIGGGVTGMVAALDIAAQGFAVDLVEKSGELGGNALLYDRTLEGLDVAQFVQATAQRARTHPRITLHLRSEVTRLDGFVGNFKSTIRKASGRMLPLQHGVVIVATGAAEYQPREYLYGRHRKVLTQTEFEGKLAKGKIDPARLKCVVMIQCVGSRDERRPYCSRICCAQALRNALAIKSANPEAAVYVINRDIMTYGFAEEYYTKAREAGVVFLRYDPEGKPIVRQRDGKLEVLVEDKIIGEMLLFSPDFLVLSTGLVPAKNRALSRMLRVPLDDDGFFAEMNSKFRPLDFVRAGVFVAGLAHSPRSLRESVTHAHAVAARAVSFLARGNLSWRGVYAHPDDELCTGCRICEGACEFNAIRINRVRVNGGYKERAEVIEAMCTGCGCCVAACPSGAMGQQGRTRDQLIRVIEATLA